MASIQAEIRLVVSRELRKVYKRVQLLAGWATFAAVLSTFAAFWSLGPILAFPDYDPGGGGGGGIALPVGCAADEIIVSTGTDGEVRCEDSLTVSTAGLMVIAQDIDMATVGSIDLHMSSGQIFFGGVDTLPKINGLSAVLQLYGGSGRVTIGATFIEHYPGGTLMATYYKPIESETPSEPVACTGPNEDALVKVDDTNDSAVARWCWCTTVDDGSNYDWRAFDDPVGTACPFF